MKKALVMAAVLVMGLAAAASAGIKTNFYGYQFLKYEYKVVGAAQDSVSDTSGFSIPRTYLRWKMDDEEGAFSAALTLDINNVKDAQENKIDWAMWVKYGYVDLKKIPLLSDIGAVLRVGLQKVYFGTVDTWEYPLIEKSIDDYEKTVSSADQGIAITGYLPEGFGSYELAVFNGSGYKDLDGNAEKAYNASVTVIPVPGISVRGSYIKNIPSAHGATTQDYNATAVVLGLGTGPIDGFVEYLIENDGKSGTVTEAISAYIGAKIVEGISVHLRHDATNPNTLVARNEKNRFIAGVNIDVAPKVMLSLNYELTQPKFPTGSSNDNTNQWLAQMKWGW